MLTETETEYQHLEPRPGRATASCSSRVEGYGRVVVAEAIHGPDPYTAEEFAEEFQVPLDAVVEALDYVARIRPLIEHERRCEAAPGAALDRR